jgi:hypothetical protein
MFDPKTINPLSMTPAEAAWTLTRAGRREVTEEMITMAITDGFPLDGQGRINALHLAAWLNAKESNHGD